ncbi:hypothetical protein B566_EDAN015095 [Ephemera danica]|nr:hypothetical protein B566_EDAN015095 [Ephemera danica]
MYDYGKHFFIWVLQYKNLRLYLAVAGCCGCCSALRPRYKRLVDNIFPVDSQDGLVKNNMEKLTFYALSSPEKLDRIGEYLFQRASRDIYRRRYGFVVIAMEAMDQLLVACHAQTLNLFVESFLKMVQKLLESSEHHLQVLATQSFVRFANIEEDTPSYHRRYDFFVSKFSSMCHFTADDEALQNKIRLAGIKGLQGVVRKTVSDDLVENIWEPVHMDKIVPSLLYNMQNLQDLLEGRGTPEPPQEERCDPPTLAEMCMRELVGRASFGHIRAVVRPVLRHLDNHGLWVPNQFAIHTFRVIMFSIQSQYSYAVVETLMSHLDENSKATPKIRTSVADVLSKIIAIAAGESIGPSVLEIINSLLTHLRHSVMSDVPRDFERDEKLYQEALINALGEFANHLPDYQKIEIMKFIMSKVPQLAEDGRKGASGIGNALLQNILLKSLLKVGTKYKTVQFTTTFPMSFLEPLLRMSLAPDADMRLLVQRILHTLIDRHHNQDKLQHPSVEVTQLGLVIEKCCQPDEIFVRKHGQEFCASIGESLEQPSNTPSHLAAVYTTLALYCVELGCKETMMDILRLLKNIQDMAITSSHLSSVQRCNLHAIVASLLALLPFVIRVAPLQEYANQIIELRRERAPHLLPPLRNRLEADDSSPGQLPSDMCIDLSTVIDVLRAAGFDVTRLQAPFDSGAPRNSWVDSGIGRGSVTDLNLTVDEDSAASSPGVIRVSFISAFFWNH